jgi:hypothetical protein
VTPERARERARKLLALAAEGSGATLEEARSAAVAAANLIVEHHLLDGDPRASAIDIDQVTELALRAMELEHALAEAGAALTSERGAHARALQARDRQWRDLVDRARREERGKAEAEMVTAERRAVREDREALGRSGGRARDRKLTDEEKSEIGKKGAEERWRKWREERGLPPR